MPSHPFALCTRSVGGDGGPCPHGSSAGRRLQLPGSTPPRPATGISQMNAPALELTALGSCSDLESNNLQGTIQTSFILFNL